MGMGFKVVHDIERADPDLVAAFAEIPTAIVSDNLHRMVAGGPELRPLHARGNLAGPALTVKTRPGDNLMIHKAVDMAAPGDVIVVDGGGDLTNALIGELIICHARSRGVVGFVVNGSVRDMDFIGANDFPVYAAGVTHRGPYKDGPGEVNVPIALGGMLITPGDIVLGDPDGVLSVPRQGAADVLLAAEAQVRREAATLEAINGAGWDRAWVDETLRGKGCEGL